MLWLFILYYGYNLSLGYFIFLIFVFSRDFVNASFCDLKDLKSDKQNKLLTIAELLREKRAIILFQITNCLSFLMIVFFSYFKLIPIYTKNLPRLEIDYPHDWEAAKKIYSSFTDSSTEGH